MDYFVYSLKRYRVLNIAAIQFLDRYPAPFGQPFQNGIGHSKRRPRYSGQIPLPQKDLLF
jgi:hypothetical protein